MSHINKDLASMIGLFFTILSIFVVWSNGQITLLPKCDPPPEPIDEGSIDEYFDKYMITPQVIPLPPPQLLYVDYFGVQARLGNKIPPYKTVLPPYINFRGNPETLYTLLFVDPDYNGLYTTYRLPVLIGIIVNSPGSALQWGNQLPYIPPGPSPGTGYHRYIHLIYQQTRPIEVSSKFIMNYTRTRNNFSIADFRENNDLGELVAGNFFIADQTLCDPYEEKKKLAKCREVYSK